MAIDAAGANPSAARSKCICCIAATTFDGVGSTAGTTATCILEVIVNREVPMDTSAREATAPLWWLPLVAGLLPAVAIAIAFQLAVAQGQFASCNPFIDGCVSISRAARHDLPNHLFRGLALPAATLQAVVWLLTSPWLQRLGAPSDRLLRLLPWIGVTAAVFLALYGTFLGTEGVSYRWMRRYGVVVYFGCTCIAMLITGGAARRVTAHTRQLRQAGTAMFALCASLPLLGLANATSPLFFTEEAARDAFGNSTEWWGAAVFTVFFVLLAVLWRATRFRAALATRGERFRRPG